MADWKNVGNWHWTEKNCIKWAKHYFETEIKGLKSQNAQTKIVMNQVESFEGDCDLHNRKGKVIALFDISFTAHWTSTTNDGTKVEGKVFVPEICHDSEEDEYVFELSAISGIDKDDSIQALFKKQMTPQLRKVIVDFHKKLIDHHTKDVQFDTKHKKLQSSKTKINELENNEKNNKDEGDRLKLEFTLATKKHDLYRVLSDAKLITIWSHCPATFVPAPGLPFKWFSGAVKGSVIKAVKDESIKMEWRHESWPIDKISTVSLSLESINNSSTPKTRLIIVHEGIPANYAATTQAFWQSKVIQAISDTFGYSDSNLMMSSYFKPTLVVSAAAVMSLAAYYLWFGTNR